MNFFLSDDDPLLSKQNVALFCLFRCKASQRLILVVNCHILFSKSRGDIKLAQVSLIMRGIGHIFKLYGKSVFIRKRTNLGDLVWRFQHFALLSTLQLY